MPNRWPFRPETLIRRFEAAHRDYVLRGTKHPEDVPRIERDYLRTRAALLSRVEGATPYQQAKR